MPRPSPDSWHTINQLLDELLDLPPESRAAWIATLRSRQPEAAAAMTAWLDEFEVMEASAFLEDRSAHAPAMSALAGLEVGAYRLVELIGQGGMGTVWLAERRDGTFDHRVAVKMLNAAFMDASGTERFSREAGILARLTHPSISRVLDAGMSSLGAPYLVLEHVQGEPIDRYCDGRRLNLTERLYLVLDVLAPVAHAHANLVVHRDLKPANVLVTPDGHVKLLDFGIAKLMHASTENPTVSGTRDSALTPAFAAPEQLTGGAITTATDVYALGVLLYQLLTGRHPSLDGSITPASLIDAVVHREPLRSSDVVRADTAGGPSPAELAHARSTTPERLGQRLAGDLDTILAKALKKVPAERYATVTALEDDLRRYLRHQPIAARPDSVDYRMRKFVRRHRVPVALAAVAVLALVGGLVGTISQVQRATAQAARADRQAVEAGVQRDAARRQLARAEAINDLNAFLIGDAAPLGTTFTARDLLARAERIVTRQQDDADGTRIESLVSIGRLYSTLGETARATTVLQQGHDLARSASDPALTARAACELGRALVKTGEIARSRDLVATGLAALGEGPQYAMARVLCRLCGANVESWAGDGDAAVGHVVAAQAAADGEALASPLLSLRIAMQLADAYRIAGRYAEANVTFADAGARLIALGREDTERAATLYNNWGLVLAVLGRTRDSEQMLRRSVAISSSTGSDDLVDPVSWGNLAGVALDLGRYDDAVRLADLSYQRSTARNDHVAAGQALLGRARARIANGAFDRAAAILDEAETRYKAMFQPDHPGFLALAIDRIRLAEGRGDFAAALDLANRTLAGADGNARRRSYRQSLLRRRAAIHLGLGRFAEARTDAEGAIAALRERIGPDALAQGVGEAYLTIGEAYLGEQRPVEARVALEAAVRHLDDAAGPDHPLARRARALIAQQ